MIVRLEFEGYLILVCRWGKFESFLEIGYHDMAKWR